MSQTTRDRYSNDSMPSYSKVIIVISKRRWRKEWGHIHFSNEPRFCIRSKDDGELSADHAVNVSKYSSVANALPVLLLEKWHEVVLCIVD